MIERGWVEDARTSGPAREWHASPSQSAYVRASVAWLCTHTTPPNAPVRRVFGASRSGLYESRLPACLYAPVNTENVSESTHRPWEMMDMVRYR